MLSAPDLKQSPLHEEHLRLGGKMTPFGGWIMPVQYSGIMDEHQTVRNGVGLFDISHMGEIIVKGERGAAWLNGMLSNQIRRLEVGECHYTFLLNEEGGVIDDLIAYRLEEDAYLLVVNASMIERDFEWLEGHCEEGVELENRSAEFAGIAIQGPRSTKLFDMIFEGRESRPARNEMKRIDCGGRPYHVARTGYTGEDGFEVFFPADHAAAVWNLLLERGEPLGIKPCGLGARDTLRLEMCYPLNGSDLSPERTPLEAGLSIFVDLQKEEFIGKEALMRQREEGVKTRLVPFKMKEQGPPPRAHYPLYKEGRKISEIASGTLSPSLNIGIGMAYMPVEFARANEEIEVDIRGKRFAATVEKKPLFKAHERP